MGHSTVTDSENPYLLKKPQLQGAVLQQPSSETMCCRIPIATYRLQFNQRFGFSDARTLVPYLESLGITDIYTSPLFQARRGSGHGYDVTDPTRFNRELGGEEGFAALAVTLRQKAMGLLLDIVPNHMAADSQNPWWCDVLRYGLDSPYATYFDINWYPPRPGLAGKVLLPILGAPYHAVLENQELSLILFQDGFWVAYHQESLPLNPKAHARILGHRLDERETTLQEDEPAFVQLVQLRDDFKRFPERATESGLDEAFRESTRRLWRLYNTSGVIKSFIDENLKILNGMKGDPRSFDNLDQILAGQNYRLAFWKVANREINYRRFFDVSGLASIRIEEEDVFEATHAKVIETARSGQVTGLRIDHIDGLHDPVGYLDRLQNRLCGNDPHPGFFVLVEKILGADEDLPSDWPVDGTTGYIFQNAVNGVFIDRRGADKLDEIYARLSSYETEFPDVVYVQKRRVMFQLFAGDVYTLSRQLGRLAEADRYGRDLTLSDIEEALVKVTACLPVYRTYIRDFNVSPRDQAYINGAIQEALARQPAHTPACEFLRRVLLLDFPADLPARQKKDWLQFVMRWQQFTGPIMAKGFEDTALYVYNRLISLNTVGGDPETVGLSVPEFHRFNRSRNDRWPHSMNTTSTHDAKRSEDVQARINVLSEVPGIWEVFLDRWRSWNLKSVVNGITVPDGNTELLIYQTLIGAWPIDEEEIQAFKERIQSYLVKSSREAKIYTNWLNPDVEYETALASFLDAIIEPSADNRFLPDFMRLQTVTAYYGALNSLSQVLLKVTSPGIPDFYQGTELWDFSLVDPDNRRPVDFKKRTAFLAELKEQEAATPPDFTGRLLSTWKDGKIKLYLTSKALYFRKNHQDLFSSGEYIPVKAAGPLNEHVCAFCRRLGDGWSLTAVPRLLARLQKAARLLEAEGTPADLTPPLNESVWGQSALVLPEGAPLRWQNVLTGEELSVVSPGITGANPADDKVLLLADLFCSFPVALLEGLDA
ncbi:MAG: malto-oligosyltrehalose synthase [Bacillota bacterium]